jgi:ADP-ribose pyrophosphatase
VNLRDSTGGFSALGEEVVLSGPVVSVVEGSFRAPDGTVFDRQIVRHPGAVAVAAVDDDGLVTLVRQYRAPFDELMIELPAGKCDVAGEPIEVTAERELAEEVGLAADRLELLVSFHNSVGFCDEQCHVFLASGLHPVPDARDGLEEQHLEVLHLPLGDALDLIRDGSITDAKTVIGLWAIERRLAADAVT